MPGRGLLGHAALQQVRDAAAELDHLEPARHLAERVREHLAVLGVRMLRDLLAPRVEELANREEELGPLRERQRAPRRERLPSRPATAWSTSSTVAKSTAPDCSPVAGLKTGPDLPDRPGYGPPEIQWLIGFTAVGASTTSVIPSLLAWSAGSVAR